MALAVGLNNIAQLLIKVRTGKEIVTITEKQAVADQAAVNVRLSMLSVDLATASLKQGETITALRENIAELRVNIAQGAEREKAHLEHIKTLNAELLEVKDLQQKTYERLETANAEIVRLNGQIAKLISRLVDEDKMGTMAQIKEVVATLTEPFAPSPIPVPLVETPAQGEEPPKPDPLAAPGISGEKL